MRSPFYIGVMRYNYRDESGTTFSFKPESEWIMFEEHHPQIVTHEQWSRVVTTMQSQRRGSPATARPSTGERAYLRRARPLRVLRQPPCGPPRPGAVRRISAIHLHLRQQANRELLPE